MRKSNGSTATLADPLYVPLNETALRAGRNAELKFSHPKSSSSATDVSTLGQDIRSSAGIEGSQPIAASMLPPRLACQASRLYTQNTDKAAAILPLADGEGQTAHYRTGINCGGSKACVDGMTCNPGQVN